MKSVLAMSTLILAALAVDFQDPNTAPEPETACLQDVATGILALNRPECILNIDDATHSSAFQALGFALKHLREQGESSEQCIRDGADALTQEYQKDCVRLVPQATDIQGATDLLILKAVNVSTRRRY